MTLSYNKKQGCFFVITKDKERAERSGLTLSTTAHGANGESVYFTADYQKKPIMNPYAVIPFYDEADSSALVYLRQIKADFDLSWQPETSYKPKVSTQAKLHGHDFRPFQKVGIEYGVKKGNVLIGDEPGLGKTLQAIGICNEIQATNVLIICPANVRLNWHREFMKWSVNDDKRLQIFKTSKGGFDQSDKSHPINTAIFSYELAKNPGLHAAILDRKWDALIIDEAHYLKTSDAGRTQAIFGGGRGMFKDRFIANNVNNIIGLTGTPLPNRPRECYTIAKALCPESIDWMGYEEFCYRYNPSAMMANGHNHEEKGRLPELQARLRSNFMIRRLKKDVLKDLPDKMYEFTYLEPNGEIKEVLQKESLLNFKVSDLKNPFSDLFGMISTLRREMGEAKVPRIVEHMRYLLDTVEVPKVVLFAHHRSVMDRLTEALKQYGVVTVRGGVSMIAKDKAVQSFRFNPDARIFLGQMDAAGVGIDGLQDVCDHVVMAEPAWTPGTNEQAIDRCHRIGQHSNVLAQFLVVEGSLDERVLAAVLEKNETINNVLDRSH
jgi:SWI/SNF-related matrix-associated actin-dependent regulator 1 of chromatin subfamily A